MTLSEKRGLQSVLVTLGAVLTIGAVAAIGFAPTARAEMQLQALDRTAAPDGATWSAPYNVSDSSEVESEMPALAVTNGGVAHIVWEEGGELNHSYREAGSWSTPSPIPGTGTSEQPAVKAGPGDRVHLVYVNDVEVFYTDVFYVAWDGSDWSLPRNVSQTGESGAFSQVSEAPDIAVAPNGSIHVVAVEQTASGSQLHYASSNDGLSWPSYGLIPSAYGAGPSINIAGEDAIHLAYRDDSEDEIYVLDRTNTGWSLPQNISNAPGAFSTVPDVAVDGKGIAEVVWQEPVSDIHQVRYSRGEDWVPVLMLSSSATGAYLPSLAVDSFGHRHVAWHDESFPFAIRHTWTSDPETWPDPGLVYASSLRLEDVSLDIGRDGVVHAVWTEIQDGKGEILYASAKVHDVFDVFLPLVMTDVGP